MNYELLTMNYFIVQT